MACLWLGDGMLVVWNCGGLSEGYGLGCVVFARPMGGVGAYGLLIRLARILNPYAPTGLCLRSGVIQSSWGGGSLGTRLWEGCFGFLLWSLCFISPTGLCLRSGVIQSSWGGGSLGTRLWDGRFGVLVLVALFHFPYWLVLA